MRSINRVLAAPFTGFFIRSGLHPNFITLLGGLAGILAFLFFSAGTKAGFIAGAVMFEMFYILDNCDGEVARARGLSSTFGSWMDTVVDCCIHTLTFVGISVGLFRLTQDPIMLFLGVAAGIGTFLSTFVAILQKTMNFGPAIHGMPKAPEGEIKRITAADRAIEVFCAGDLSLVVLLFAVLNRMELFLWLGAIGANIFCIVLLAVNFKYLTGRQ